MEQKGNKEIIVYLCLVLFFSFFVGYYCCYRINEKQKTKLEIIQEIMENEWYYGIEDEDIESTLENKMILSVENLEKDPYTRYLTSLGTLADSYTGLGIEVVPYGDYFVIREVSSKASTVDGLKKGDIIVEINNIDIKNKTINELISIIGNEDVTLKIVRDSVEITINTRVTTYDPLTVFTNEYTSKIAYAKISEFNLDTAFYLEEYLSSLAPSYTNLILDLRGNPGGYVSSVNEVLDLFVTSNKVSMVTIDKKGNKSVVKTEDDSCYIFNNIYVLIDGDSASGAEALSLALNYHLDGVVTLYGDQTFGKGSAQKTYYFDDGTYFHYTYALWYGPGGDTINHMGVTPEVKVINDGVSKYTLYDIECELYSYGDAVKVIQQILTKLGYYSEDKIHSFMDEDMVDAIEKFQEDNGLTITGKVDKEFLRYMSKIIYDDKVSFDNDVLGEVIGELSK